jgi:uncharacterized OB-fold protein
VIVPPVRPVPVPDSDTQPFWDACRQHKLKVQWCDSCDTLRFPPACICYRCRSYAHHWHELPGTGTIYSWVVVVHPVLDSFAAEVPFAVALIDVAAGVRIPTRLVNLDPKSIYEGMPVQVTFDDSNADFTLPLFEPRS